MQWITLPNVPVRDFRDRMVQTAALDDDLEIIYRPIRCPGESCAERFTNLSAFQDHVYDHAEDLSAQNMPVREARVDLDVAHLIFQVLGILRNASQDHPIAKIRKANDSMHAERTWQRAWVARDDNGPVRLHAKQYEWLQQLFARKIPLSKEDKADNVEVQTFAQFLFGLSWHRYTQALTIESEREQVVPAEAQPPAPMPIREAG